MLRSEFGGAGEWRMPVIPKAEFGEEEFVGLKLIGFDRVKGSCLNRMVHFFLYDYSMKISFTCLVLGFQVRRT